MNPRPNLTRAIYYFLRESSVSAVSVSSLFNHNFEMRPFLTCWSCRSRWLRSTTRDLGDGFCQIPMRPLLRPSQPTLKSIRSPLRMSRRERSSSTSSFPRESKRPRLEAPLTSEDYKNGIVLAPMVRSGARKPSTIVGLFVGVGSRFFVLKCLRDFSL